MKSIACLILATQLAGCAHFDKEAFMAGFNARWPKPQQNAVAESAPQLPPSHMPRVEYACMSNCTSLNQYSYAFCQSKCTY
jgi:hypothetical protein